jgi:hypothetical protein
VVGRRAAAPELLVAHQGLAQAAPARPYLPWFHFGDSLALALCAVDQRRAPRQRVMCCRRFDTPTTGTRHLGRSERRNTGSVVSARGVEPERQTPAEERAAVARVSSGRTQLGIAPGRSAGQLPAAVNSEVAKCLLQVPLDRAGAKERPRTL